MKKKFFLFVSLVLLAVQGWATEVNPTSLQFSTDVGQTVTQTISIKFADAEQSDPNTPVVMSPSYGTPLQSIGQASGDYSVSIQGAGSQMFSAEITMRSFTSNACTVKVTYNPTTEGAHQATLNVNCSSAGVPTVSVNLTGITTNASDDPFTHLPSGLGSVNTGNGKGLPEGFVVDNPANVKPDIRIVKEIFDLLKESPLFYLVEVDESETFNNVTLGSTTTKRFEAHVIPDTEWVLDLLSYHLGRIKIKLNLISAQIEQDGIPVIGSEMFSVYPSSLGVSDLRNHKEITVTYKPTAVGMHAFVFAHTYDLSLLNLTDYPDLIDYLTVLPTPLSAPYIGTAVDRHITVNPSTYAFEPTYKDDVKTKKITVKGTNLTGNLNVTPSSSSNFTVNPTTITAAQAQSANGAEVMVTYNPKAVGSHSATFTISGGGALPETFSVSGSCELPPPPTITVDQTPLNFGTVNLGDDPNTKTITVKGTNLASDLNLSISGASGSMFTALPYRISPADAAAGRPVVVTYKPTAVGTHTATLVITGGGVDPVEISLSGKCLPAPTINVNPSIYDFGTINLGDTKTKTFTVTGSNSSERISVVNQMETTGGEYTISPTSLPASGGTVTVTFKPLSAGSSGAVFTLSNGVASCKITVEGNCASITASPSSWNFGSVAKNSTNTKKITVKGYNLTGNLTITPESNSYFTVSPTTITAAQAQSANGVEVTVTYKPTAVGNHSATFTISDGVASKSISLSGKCEYLTANPSTYDFGTVVKGNQSTKTFTVTGSNSSERISVVNQMETTGGEYTISPTSLPASGGTVTVTFKPLSAGSSGAVFTLSNGVASCKITVEGKCVNPPTPSITTNTTSLVFGGYNDSRTFRVTGTNLTGSLTLTSNNSIFTVTPSTITASQAANGVTVTVKCNAATNIQHAIGKITISGGGAPPKYVNLTLDATSPQPYAPLVEPEGEGDDDNNGYINVELLGANGNNTASVNELEMNSKVYADRLNIIIESPVEQKAVISDIAGHIREVDLEAGRNEIPVNASGIYIVRIREKSTKLMLK